MVITIDGPAASGKSTVAEKVAKRLKFRYVDTGAMYRALTWRALEKKVDLFDEDALGRLARRSNISFKWGGSKQKIFVDRVDVTRKIRTPRIDSSVSVVSKVPGVRKIMIGKQRELGRDCNLVAEGRDTGTVVFPQAELKIFLTASPLERARRRQTELRERGHNVDVASLEREIIARDRIDSTRKVSPLVRSRDANLIDTTDKSVDEVVREVLRLYERVKGKR